MPDDPKFESLQELLDYVQQHADDIESFTIPLPRRVALQTKERGTLIDDEGVGGLVKFLGGKHLILSVEHAQWLVNDETLHRLRIPIKLAVLKPDAAAAPCPLCGR